MNEFLPGRFSESIKRLALGLEPIDFGQRLRIGHPINISFDTAPRKLPRPPIYRHRSCLFVLLYDPKLTSPVNLRFLDAERRFVPRRLSIPILTRSVAEASPHGHRVRRPVLFPGAAYDVGPDATGLRGRVLRNGKAMRWARAEARLPISNQLVGQAHGDDRGEFLLLINSRASPVGDLQPVLRLEITVFGPSPVLSSPAPDYSSIDPLWDLPLEQASFPGDPDPVSAGEVLPPNYLVSTMQTINFQFGRILSGITFTIP
jgi:hypothetical protein